VKTEVMSVAEMKQELLQKIEKIDDELLLRKVTDLINNPQPRPSIKEMYSEVVQQYGDTLSKLAQ
jgi:hypothetical protein